MYIRLVFYGLTDGNGVWPRNEDRKNIIERDEASGFSAEQYVSNDLKMPRGFPERLQQALEQGWITHEELKPAQSGFLM